MTTFGVGVFSVLVIVLVNMLVPASGRQCLPDQLLYGCTSWIPKYESICCQTPQNYAEHSGFLMEPDVRFFDRLLEMQSAFLAGGGGSSIAKAAGAEALSGVHVQKSAAGGVEFVFYDSQCSVPLFVAPRGRTFDEFRKESENHGWPSFRDAEIVASNIKIISGGEVVSSCPQPTHLGHRFSDGMGYRYCIDLLCMAGQQDSALSGKNVSSMLQSTGGSPQSAAFARAGVGLLATLGAVLCATLFPALGF
mmetsp:Transcript_110068/g.350603  ORF Transcript_110068/g.350603 Transcript_110068/m.350603 type:complete len:250 (+) Transcript_110068:221-970(+)